MSRQRVKRSQVKRRARHSGGTAAGTTYRIKQPFPFNLFTHARAFWIIAALLMVASVAIGAVAVQTQSRSREQPSDEDFEVPAAAATATTEPAAEVTPPVTGTAMIKRYSTPPAMTIDPEKRYVATLKTAKGDVKIELFPKDAPQTVNSFVFLAREGFYDGVTWHRVLPGFVAQTGDPTGTGSGGPGYQIPDEISGRRFEEGAVGMANAGPNTNGSQFFITYAPQPSLNGRYTVFGRVIEGFDVLKALTPRDPQRDPRAAPGDKLLTVTIEEQE